MSMKKKLLSMQMSSYLLNAVTAGQWQSALELIRNGADVNAQDYKNRTVLFHALGVEQADKVRKLLETGSSGNLLGIVEEKQLCDEMEKRLELIDVLIMFLFSYKK